MHDDNDQIQRPVPSQLPNVDFLVIGAYRAGTTWLHSVFEKNPEIYVTPEKEIMFFSHHYDKGPQWYLSFFADRSKETVAGEVCPTYLGGKDCAERIHKHLPNVRIIAVLRRPSEQIHSLYRLRHQRGLTKRTFADDLRSDPSYLGGVQYFQQLSAYFERFPAQQVLVSLYDDLDSDPQAFLTEVYAFLGVPPLFPDEVLSQRVNRVSALRYPAIERLISRGARALRSRGLLHLKLLVGRLGVHRLIRKLNQRREPLGEEALSPPAELELIRRSTEEDRAQLSALLGRDLTQWV